MDVLLNIKILKNYQSCYHMEDFSVQASGTSLQLHTEKQLQMGLQVH